MAEALVMIESQQTPEGHDDDEMYQAGDIVVVRPAGWPWGINDRKEFLIVTLDVAEADGLRMEEPVEVEFEDSQRTLHEILYPEELLQSVQGKGKSPPRRSRRGKDMVIRRRFHLDLSLIMNALSNADRAKILDKNVEFQPFKGQRFKPLDKLAQPEKMQKLKNAILQRRQAGRKEVKWHQRSYSQ